MMDIDYFYIAFWCLMMVVAIVAIWAIVTLTLHEVNGENYTYNMTKEEREEFWLSEICINTSIKIPNCAMISGKTNSDYGEAIESAKQK